MPDQPAKLASSGTLLVWAVGLILLLMVLASQHKESQRNNQIIRPHPDAPPPPVVPELPSLAADLQRVKVLCEARARAVQSVRRIGAGQLADGQRRYEDVRADHEGCIAYLKVAILRRFNGDDPDRVTARMASVNLKARAFERWATSVLPPASGGLQTAEHASEVDRAGLDAVRKANDEAVRALIAELDQCRMRTWEDVRLGSPPPPW